MSKIKVSELFYSIQGEGRYMGVPSIFLRTFGCNFRCTSFGRSNVPVGEKANPEVATVISRLSTYTDYNSLPLVTTGCDSYAAVYPEFKNLSPMVAVDDVAFKINQLLPFKQWKDEHLVITGGEPLLGWQRAYPELLSQENMLNLKELTFETNGTQELAPEFKDFLKTWKQYAVDNKPRGREALTFSVSAKLSCSGESHQDAILPKIVCEYEEIGHTYLKFVIATKDDADEAMAAIAEYRSAGFEGHIYLMPVGGIESVYSMNNRAVADLALKAGLRYSDRLQVPLFKNAWAT